MARKKGWPANYPPSGCHGVLTTGVVLDPTVSMISFPTAQAIVYIDEQGNQRTIPSGALAAGCQHVMRMTKLVTGANVVGWYN